MRRFDAALGAQHPFVWQTRSNIGVTIANQGRLAEAERWVREALAGLAKLEPRQPSYDTWIADRLAEMLCWRGSGAEAASLLQPVISYRLETFGADHPETAGARRNLAEALRINGDLARARETIDLALSVYSAQSPDSAEAGAAWFVSGKIARDAGELTRAERELSEAVERLEAKLPSSDWRRDAARAALGSVQAALGQKAGRGVAAAARRALIEKLGATDPRVPREDLEPVLTRGQGPGRARQRTGAVAG
jgi:tetratricopeptide (TPR) repeat protein